MENKLNWKLPGNVVPPITPVAGYGKIDCAKVARNGLRSVTTGRSVGIKTIR
jgi:hypothetical protein